jgi:hypothetical protein
MGKAGNPEDFGDGTERGRPEGQKAGGAEAGAGLPTEYTENTEEAERALMTGLGMSAPPQNPRPSSSSDFFRVFRVFRGQTIPLFLISICKPLSDFRSRREGDWASKTAAHDPKTVLEP